MARLAVEDEGPGIPAGERERIFTPFYRLARDVESASGGSGIGLAVVRELVDLHDGRVEVETAPGGGARFGVTLPVGASEPQLSGGGRTGAHVAVAVEGA